MQNKRGEHFSLALVVIVLSIAIVSVAFLSEDTNLTGFVAYEEQDFVVVKPNLMVFDDINSLRTLAAGNYYADGNGIIYWVDDDSRPAVAKVNSISESQKNRKIHIDNEGNVGYLLE